MAKLMDLKQILEEDNLLDRTIDFNERYNIAIKNQKIRDLLELEIAPVSNLTDVLQIQNKGEVHAIRMDLQKYVENHKKPTMAGLVLRGVLQGQIPREEVDTFIDAGSYSNALALGYYANKFGMKTKFIMSRLWPDYITKGLEKKLGKNFEVIRAPRKLDHAREREFYEYLVELLQDSKFRKDKFCTWHVKHGQEVAYPFGKEIAENLDFVPDYLVSCVGAASGLSMLAAVQDYFKGKPKIVVAENEVNPLFAKRFPTRKSERLPERIRKDTIDIFYNYDFHFRKLPKKTTSTMILGPHIDEINNKIPQDLINRIKRVDQYSKQDWQATHHYLNHRSHTLYHKPLEIGTSSAANIATARRIGDEGNKVLTFSFEPFRSFYYNTPWIFRWETPAQKVAAVAAGTAWVASGVLYALSNGPSIPFG